MNTIDCRGLACPAPVIQVKKALETADALVVLLDDGAPRENVTRYCRSHGCQVSEVRDGAGWSLTVTSSGMSATPPQPPHSAGRVILVTSDRIGSGPEALGRLLMKNFIHTLLEAEVLPGQILFVNSGVTLACDGSDVLEALEKLRCMGVEISSCGLCLDFFDLKGKLRIGGTTNMLSIVDRLLSSAQTITL